MTESPAPNDPSPIDPATVRYLRLLVSVLTVTMIAGIIVIVALFVIRFSGSSGSAAPVLPDEITLPDGTTPLAVTTGPGWYAVVTADDRILIFDRDSGALRQTVQIAP